MDAEVELWDKYMAPATFMTCGKHEGGAKDLFHPLFLKPNSPTRRCNEHVPGNMEDAMKADGPIKYWDVAVRTDMGGVRGAMVEYPMVIHRALGGQPRTGFAKEVEKDDAVTQQALNNYRSCSVSPDMLGADPATYSNGSYLKRKDEGPCPEDPSQELVQNVLSEYDRLGSDSVNKYVRETVLGKWKDEKSNFTVMDVGCGIGGTMYSLAAKGHLNPHVASYKAGKANPKKTWRGGSSKSQAHLHYVGVALSSAEVVMAKKEGEKADDDSVCNVVALPNSSIVLCRSLKTQPQPALGRFCAGEERRGAKRRDDKTCLRDIDVCLRNFRTQWLLSNPPLLTSQTLLFAVSLVAAIVR